ncbi:DNA-3-methyladenine glycosylase [Labilibaculum sp. A4]|uniref:DNA-3-methyladenine glycosylase n=1 Tax=Labilibaculum euxinus TaxID=2686357 RepID=UPI000F61AE1F|nr:DNA-3-methyladenine glycosylase [Labilibaculum euxinus]MDQ1770089.1 DNA-3-methyladenine glycosylase [Labilibaculum euxinus]MWN77510.1 DNA-3-methyladenine glycosylase [Labilibaculum euxinus]
MSVRLKRDFFLKDIHIVAHHLVGKIIVRKFDTMKEERFRITEIEMYVGEVDLASHASKGRTKRTEVMYSCGGCVYVYLIYGMYWMLNIVTGKKNQAQAILIRGVEGIDGPGKIGQQLKLNKSFYGENLENSNRIWVEDDGMLCNYTLHPRINVEYAGDIWKNKLYRYKIEKAKL